MTGMSRRAFLLGSALAGAGALGACGQSGPSGVPVAAKDPVVGDVEAQRQRAGQRIVNARLSPRPVEVDLGGIVLATWAYDQTVPGPVLRAGTGDLLRVEVDNQLDEPTSVHWHGIALRNDMDGVPGLTQEAIEPGDRFIYEFTVPDAGTHWYHSHSGLQLDRGLYGPLIIDDPAEPGDFDHEWVVVVDDWLDGIDGTPDDAARALGIDTPNAQGKAMGHGRMHGGGPRNQNMTSRLLGAAGDVSYPHFLLNGKVPADPDRWTARPGQRAKIRFVNAGADTFFRVTVGGHTMTVTHTDGFPTTPHQTESILLAMGERVDVLITLADGVFPIFADAEGKNGHALAIVRTGAGDLPTDPRPIELDRPVLLPADLTPAPASRLTGRGHDRYLSVDLGGSMMPYRWTLNGQAHPDTTPLEVSRDQRVRMRLRNMSDMAHPMHLHGHTFALAGSGLRKDTVTIRPMRTAEIEFDTDNPGQWALHCHNAYHMEAGMMTTLSYLA